jgi:hypothetical protein
VATFPEHFHDGSEDHVVESHLNEEPEQALRELPLFGRGSRCRLRRIKVNVSLQCSAAVEVYLAVGGDAQGDGERG